MDFLHNAWEELAHREETGRDWDESTEEETLSSKISAKKERVKKPDEKISYNAQLYEKIKNEINSVTDNRVRKDLQETLNAVLDSAVSYSEAVSSHIYINLPGKEEEFENRENKERKDHARRIAHEALVAQLNSFCRLCSLYKIDINFMRDIVVGGNEEEIRNKVRKWAFDVLDYLGIKAN